MRYITAGLIELSELLLDEKKAEEYLLKVGILKTFTKCKMCGSNRITKISRGKHRCNSCLSEWSNKKGSVLYNNNLSYSKFIGIVKLFTLELTAEDASVNMDANLKTTKGIFHKLRLAVTEISETELDLIDGTLKGESPEFLITSDEDYVNVRFTKVGERSPNLFRLIRTRTPSKETSYSFKFSQITSRNIKEKIEQFPKSLNYFWRYARERLLSYRGTKLKYLYLYLKEIEFRYNNRHKNLFDKIVAKIACFPTW